MAGDWIPVRTDLHEDPAVIHISRRTGLRPEEVVGWLVRIWGWIDRQMDEARARGVSTLDVCLAVGLGAIPRVENVTDRGDILMTGVTAQLFADALLEVGWASDIRQNAGELPTFEVPQFDRWFSASGKRRLRNARNQRRKRLFPENGRAPQCSAKGRKSRVENVTGSGDILMTTGQERREQKSPPTPPGAKMPRSEWRRRASGYGRDLPPAVRPAWDAFLDSRTGTPKESVLQSWLAKVQAVCESPSGGPDAAVTMLDECLPWKGIPPSVAKEYQLGTRGKGPGPSKPQSRVIEYAETKAEEYVEPERAPFDLADAKCRAAFERWASVPKSTPRYYAIASEISSLWDVPGEAESTTARLEEFRR